NIHGMERTAVLRADPGSRRHLHRPAARTPNADTRTGLASDSASRRPAPHAAAVDTGARAHIDAAAETHTRSGTAPTAHAVASASPPDSAQNAVRFMTPVLNRR